MPSGSEVIAVLACAALMSSCRPSASDLENADANGRLPPLCTAAKKGDLAAVKTLLASGADPNAADTEGCAPLQYASSSGKIAVVEALLAKGANPRARDGVGSTALHAAAVNREVRIAEALLAAGAEVDAQTTDKVTPLMASIGSPYSDPEMSLKLIKAGADVNIANSRGETALWIAASDSSVEVVEELLKRGANPNGQSRGPGFPGYTPLHMAAMNGATKVVALLLQYGADPTIRNDAGEIPLDVTHVRFEDVRKLLTRHSEDAR